MEEASVVWGVVILGVIMAGLGLVVRKLGPSPTRVEVTSQPMSEELEDRIM